MKPAKVSIAIAMFAYSGNGGIASTIPAIAKYLAKVYHQLKLDDRVDRVGVEVYCDTPITMTRNRAIRDAKNNGFDMILMLDSDNEPDAYVKVEADAKPFMDVAFPFAYDRLLKGIPTVIAAPYCGPPPSPIVKPGFRDGGEIPYLFEWMDDESDVPDPRRRLELMTRNEAARLKGIYPVAALPTGVCLFTLNAFEGLSKPYFKYEWNEDHSEKLSTEDVVATRDISLFWKMTKGYDVLYAACDSWALHHKTKLVGKPRITPVEVMANDFWQTIRDNHHEGTEQRMVDFTANLPRVTDVLAVDQDTVFISDEELARAEAEALTETGGSPGEPPPYTVMKVSGAETRFENPLKLEPVVVPGGVSEDEVEDEPSSEPSHKSNGAVLKHKMVSGKKVAILGEELPTEDLEALTALTSWVASHKEENPIEAAVVHCGTGQGMAAILPILPSGSHLLGIDNLMAQENGTAMLDQIVLSFANEVASGPVILNVSGRQLPKRKYDLDFIFLERFVTKELIARWIKHVSPGGVLAGRGGTDLVQDYANENGLTFRASGGLWAIPVGVSADAI
jgi:hypothetical protein